MKLLFVHAHPDDETINNGITIPYYISLGHDVTVVTFIRGGERENELKNAMNILGVNDFRVIGNYSDTPPLSVAKPGSLLQEDTALLAANLTNIILEIKPDVLITYDKTGGSGHADHIKVHNVCIAANLLAKKNNWDIPRIYFNAMDKKEYKDCLQYLNNDFIKPIEDEYDFINYNKIDFIVDKPEYLNKKIEALKAHKSQIKIDGLFYALSDKIGKPIMSKEFYTLYKGIKNGDLL